MLARLQQVPEEVVSKPERSFVLEAATKQGMRLDGRALLEPRTCEITVSTVAKSKSLSKCTLGKLTSVACTVSAEITLPYPDRPNEGIFTLQTDYMHSAGTRANAILDLQALERALLKAVDVESLCLVAGLRVWSVRCHVLIIDDCGAIADACSLAACSALLHFRRPDVTVMGEEIVVHSIEDRIPIPLALHFVPVAVTFALIDNPGASAQQQDEGLLALLDPTEREETVAEGGAYQVFLNAHLEVCGLHEGGPFVTRTLLTQLMEVASAVRKERDAVLQLAVLSSPFI
jgi:exosome complex component RRP45